MVKFSVIIPCYHYEEFVGKAIKSVQAQSFTDYEILVMCEEGDDASINTVRECGRNHSCHVLRGDGGRLDPGDGRYRFS